jgi:hypothetical protein
MKESTMPSQPSIIVSSLDYERLAAWMERLPAQDKATLAHWKQSWNVPKLSNRKKSTRHHHHEQHGASTH